MIPTNHTELLNCLIQKHNLKSYLEIGINNPANNFDKINIDWDCKKGVDPEVSGVANIACMTSDEFFEQWEGGRIDLIFIDGLHHADQVKRDFDNSLRCLNEGGFIVIHDTLPENEEGTLIPRITKRWWGDVYKFAMLIASYKEVESCTLNMDEGCMVVWKSDKYKNLPGDAHPENIAENITWDLYIKHREIMMNIIEPAEYFK